MEIPQVKETYEVLLSKPFQMWGAEMGVNEHGVIIGNEAVFTKFKFAKTNRGLSGMDLLRLALERCKNASSALETITELLTEYGQDVCGGYQNSNFFYHNSFIIADRQEAWVLETADRQWVAQKIKGFRSISNGLTIEAEYDLISPKAIDTAYQKKWLKKGEDFNFRKAYSDFLMTYMSSCKIRQTFTQQKGTQNPTFNISEAFEILASHAQTESFKPSKAKSNSICMHPTGLLNPSQSNGSMVVENRQNQASTIWLSGTSMPCLSVYKPFYMGGKSILQGRFAEPSSHFDQSLWWQAEYLHRSICLDYQRLKPLIQTEKIALQTQFQQKEQALVSEKNKIQALDIFSEECLIAYLEKLKDWTKKISSAHPTQASQNIFYRQFIRYQNRKAGLIIKY
jgi:dipeptidase